MPANNPPSRRRKLTKWQVRQYMTMDKALRTEFEQRIKDREWLSGRFEIAAYLGIQPWQVSVAITYQGLPAMKGLGLRGSDPVTSKIYKTTKGLVNRWIILRYSDWLIKTGLIPHPDLTCEPMPFDQQLTDLNIPDDMKQLMLSMESRRAKRQTPQSSSERSGNTEYSFSW